MSRALGVDLGSRRIGVAVSDDDGRVATAVATVQRGPGRPADHMALARLVADYGAGVVVVGLPLSLSGAKGPAATAVLEEVEELRSVLAVPVQTHDERFTTVSATSALRAGGHRSRRRREVVDQVAAAVMLQSWLDAGGWR